MSSKKVKGTKLNLGAFVTSTGGSDPDALPTGPAARSPDERNQRGGRWDKYPHSEDRSIPRRRNDRNGDADINGGEEEDYPTSMPTEEAGPSRADEAAVWRRGPDPVSTSSRGGDRGGGGYGRDNRDRDTRGGDRRDTGSDRDRDRRYGGRSGMSGGDSSSSNSAHGGDPEGDSSRSESASDWRSARTAPPSRRDDDRERRGDLEQSNARSFGRVSAADSDAEWRKYPMHDNLHGTHDSDRRTDDGRFSDRQDRGYGGQQQRGYGDRYTDRERDNYRDSKDSSYRDRDRDRDSYRDKDRDRDRPPPRDSDPRDRSDYPLRSSDRGHDRGYDRDPRSSSSPGRGSYDEQPVPERPARLKNLLKKKDSEDAQPGASTEAQQQENNDNTNIHATRTSPASSDAESAGESTSEKRHNEQQQSTDSKLESQKGVSEERHFASLERERDADRNRERERETDRGGERDRPDLRGSLRDSIRDRRDDFDSSPNRVPELTAIKLSATKRSGGAASGPNRLEPNRATATDSGNATSPSASSASASAAVAPSYSSSSSVAAVPLSMDTSRYAEDVLKPKLTTKKTNPFDLAVKEKQSVNDQQLTEHFSKLDLSRESVQQNVSVVLAKSLIEGKVTLQNLVKNIKETKENAQDSASLMASVLQAYRDRKSDRELSKLVADSGVDVLSVLSPAGDAIALDKTLTEHKLLVLKPVPAGLTQEVSTLLSSGASNQQVIDILNNQVSPDTPILPVTKLVGTAVFDRLLSTKPFNAAALQDDSDLLTRVATDSAARVSLLFCAQVSWHNKSAAAKGQLKDVFQQLLSLKIVRAADFLLWRDDLKEKAVGKPKALLQVNAWMKEVEEQAKKEQPKLVEEEEEEGERHGGDDEDDEDDEDEDDDEDEEDEDDFPRRRK